MSKAKLKSTLKNLKDSVDSEVASNLEISLCEKTLNEHFLIVQNTRYPGAASLDAVLPEDTTPDVFAEIQEVLSLGRGDVEEANRWRDERDRLKPSGILELGDDLEAHLQYIRELGENSSRNTSMADAQYAAAKRLKKSGEAS